MLCVALGGLLGGCHREPPPRVLERVVIAPTEGADRLGAFAMQEDQLVVAAARALSEGGGFLVAAGEVHPRAVRYQARVWFHQVHPVPSGPGGHAAAHVSVTLEVWPVKGGETLREAGEADATLNAGEVGLGGPFVRAVNSALGDAARAVAQRFTEERKSDAALVRDLESPDARTRERAIDALAQRKHAAAVPALIRRLSDSDPDTSERAIGALAEIGDARAVLPLIDLAHRRGGRTLQEIARIVGDLGGKDARNWLGTLRAGHPDPAVRSVAAEVLADMDARAKMEASR